MRWWTSLTEGHPPPVPDFAALLEGLATRSAQWADIEPALGSKPYPNGILLEGKDAVRNVFKVSAATLEAAGEININVPVGSTTLINVTGTSYSLGNTSTIRYYDASTGTYRDWGRDAPTTDLAKLRDGTLWNFPDATKIDFLKGFSWQGSILAPLAVMTDVQICKKVMTPKGRALERIRVHAGDTVRFRVRITNLGTETARNGSCAICFRRR